MVGAAAAVGGAVGAGALLRAGGPAAPSAASSRDAAPGGGGVTAPFADVAADDPGAEAMRWADETGVQPTLSPAGYCPQEEVTRGDAAVALHRLAGAPAVDLRSVPVLFTDLGADPARITAVLWLHGRGALWGDAELRVRPDEPATQDCTAMMLTALLRPALAGVGATWDASTEVAPLRSEGPGSAVTRADLAVSLHRANSIITDALG
ncbi:hypothetical protein CFK38_03195 [Brachybacterium vulturis]|uniref:SLH domain-containing protein n=1 Tax=Brachybacterium vulturis TaxID=2017484 RepID=A0A291GSA3_9MICO|nr:hypothetical protein CFK38_03195 [Brachybacterium vulturis]